MWDLNHHYLWGLMLYVIFGSLRCCVNVVVCSYPTSSYQCLHNIKMPSERCKVQSCFPTNVFVKAICTYGKTEF